MAGGGVFGVDLQDWRQDAGMSQCRPWDAWLHRHTDGACHENAGRHPFLIGFGRSGGTNGSSSAIALACPDGHRCRCPEHVILNVVCAAAGVAVTRADSYAGDGHLLRFLQVRRLNLLERRLLSEWLDLA